MAITFTYTESTNKVVVTEGTSGTPATFANFVTFDRTVATGACTIGSGAELKAAATIGAFVHECPIPAASRDFQSPACSYSWAKMSALACKARYIWATSLTFLKMVSGTGGRMPRA